MRSGETGEARKSQSLEEAETEAKQILLPELEGHLKLARDFVNLIGETASLLGMRPLEQRFDSFGVTSLLIVRLANDLRCLGLLAERGYALQALTIASSIYEIGITIAYIGGDNGIAGKWLDHNKHDRMPFNLKAATKEVFRKCAVPDPDRQAESDYYVYQQFCMAKHGNPMLQTAHGLIPRGEDLVLQNGPDLSEMAINNLWYAMDHAVRFVYVALAIFASNHVPPEQQHGISERANQLAKERERLRGLARQRWGTEDPFKAQ